MAPESTALTKKVSSGSPFQLEESQTLRASSSLLKHLATKARVKEASSTTKNLLADPKDSTDDVNRNPADSIWLVIATKKHIVDKKRLKPGKILLPHSLNTLPTTTVCLITADPQRQFKDIISHVSFPSSLSTRITRVLGLSKLKARYKSFESKRQLLAEHDVFLADTRIIAALPQILGKTFYKGGSKRPIPVDLQLSKSQRKELSPPPLTVKHDGLGPRAAVPVRTPLGVAHRIEQALSCALVHLSPGASSSVRVGLGSFTPEQLAKNVEVVVCEMVEKFVTKKWRNVRAIHIKGPNTMALPIWLAEELWVDEADVLENDEAKKRADFGKQLGKRKRKESVKAIGEGAADAHNEGNKETGLIDDGFSKEMKVRREKLRKQKEEQKVEVAGDTKGRIEDKDQEATVVKKRRVGDTDTAGVIGKKGGGKGREKPGKLKKVLRITATG